MNLVLDECILNKKLRKRFNETEGYDFLTCFDVGYNSGDEDEILIEKATKVNRLVLTIDFRTITEDKFPPCNDSGILQFDRNKITPEYIIPRLEALRVLKIEDKAVGHFTYFTDDGIKIVTHKETIERKFDDYEELRDIERG